MKVSVADKILSRSEAVAVLEKLREQGLKIGFTNGCFDIVHAGHVDYLAWAAGQADRLVVGLNSDASVRRYKGDKRPLVCQEERARVIASLAMVDYVVVFDEDEPAPLIADLLPDVLIKGEDWAHFVSGREIVERHGGRVALAPLTAGRSTSALIKKIIEVYGEVEERG